MSYGFTENDSSMSIGKNIWHKEGTVLEQYPGTVAEALKASGLDWTVSVRQSAFPVTENVAGHDLEVYKKADNFFLTVRDDIEFPLGSVTKKYKVIQNTEAFSFMDNLIGSDMHFETAGSLHDGRRVWILCRVPDYVSVAGDEVAKYVFISNSHDGKSSCVAAVTPIRIVCANTLSWAISQAKTNEKKKKVKRVYTVRHMGNTKLNIHEARRLMDLTVDYYEQFKVFGDALALENITEKALTTKVLDKLYPTDESMSERVVTNRDVAKSAIMSIFRGEGQRGDTTGNAPGTKWCAANAIAEYMDHGRKLTVRGSQVQRSFEDTTAKQKALDLVIAA